MGVIGKYFIVEKHKQLRGHRLGRRRFNEEINLEEMKELAAGYAKERGQDFLIVQVVTEVSKPAGEQVGSEK